MVFAGMVGITQLTVLVTALIEGVQGIVEDTYWNPLGIASSNTILLATAEPLLLIVILNIATSPNCCGFDQVNDFSRDKTGKEENVADAVSFHTTTAPLYRLAFTVFEIVLKDWDKINTE